MHIWCLIFLGHFWPTPQPPSYFVLFMRTYLIYDVLFFKSDPPPRSTHKKQYGTHIKHQDLGFQVNSSILAEICPLYTFNIFNPITAQKTVLSKSLKHKALFLCLIISYGVCAENIPLKSLIFHNFFRINNSWNCSLHLIYTAIFFTFWWNPIMPDDLQLPVMETKCCAMYQSKPWVLCNTQ